MQDRKNRYMVIPPFVFESMARQGVEYARMSVQASHLIQKKRITMIVEMRFL